MELFGIGALELIFILIIILLVAGPKDIARTARNLGRALNRLYKSPSYHAIRRASDELRNLPQRLAQEAQLEELQELKKVGSELKDTANTIGQQAQDFEAWVPDPTGPSAPAESPLPTAPPPAPRRPPPGVPRPETTAALKARAAQAPAHPAEGDALPPPDPQD